MLWEEPFNSFSHKDLLTLSQSRAGGNKNLVRGMIASAVIISKRRDIFGRKYKICLLSFFT